MADSEYKERTFIKQVGDETLTRQVTSPQAEVAALFDGFAEQGATTTTRSSSGGRSGAASNTGGSQSS